MYADIDQDGTVDRIQLSSDEDEEGESLDARTQAHIYFRNGSEDPNNENDDEVIKIDFMGVVSVYPIPCWSKVAKGTVTVIMEGTTLYMVYALNNGIIKRYGTKSE